MPLKQIVVLYFLIICGSFFAKIESIGGQHLAPYQLGLNFNGKKFSERLLPFELTPYFKRYSLQENQNLFAKSFRFFEYTLASLYAAGFRYQLDNKIFISRSQVIIPESDPIVSGMEITLFQSYKKNAEEALLKKSLPNQSLKIESSISSTYVCYQLLLNRFHETIKRLHRKNAPLALLQRREFFFQILEEIRHSSAFPKKNEEMPLPKRKKIFEGLVTAKLQEVSKEFYKKEFPHFFKGEVEVIEFDETQYRKSLGLKDNSDILSRKNSFKNILSDNKNNKGRTSIHREDIKENTRLDPIEDLSCLEENYAPIFNLILRWSLLELTEFLDLLFQNSTILQLLRLIVEPDVDPENLYVLWIHALTKNYTQIQHDYFQFLYERLNEVYIALNRVHSFWTLLGSSMQGAFLQNQNSIKSELLSFQSHVHPFIKNLSEPAMIWPHRNNWSNCELHGEAIELQKKITSREKKETNRYVTYKVIFFLRGITCDKSWRDESLLLSPPEVKQLFDQRTLQIEFSSALALTFTDYPENASMEDEATAQIRASKKNPITNDMSSSDLTHAEVLPKPYETLEGETLENCVSKGGERAIIRIGNFLPGKDWSPVIENNLDISLICPN